MQARGFGGSGQELAARLAAEQGGVQQASANSLNVAAQSRNSAIQALKDSANLAGQIGQNQLDFDAMKAKAADETRRSNLERLQQSMMYNVGQQNQANLYNTNRANSTLDKNTGLSNEEQAKNKNLLMEDYNNQVNRLQGISGAKIGAANNNLENAKNTAAGYSGLLNSLGGAIGGIMNKTSSTPDFNSTSALDSAGNPKEVDDSLYNIGNA